MNVPPIERTSSAEAGRTSYARHLGAEPLGGRDRLQAGDPGAEHQHLRRRDGAGGGHEQRQEARQPHRRLEHAPVPGDQRLGGEGVHRLRARDARHQLEGERGDLRVARAPARWRARCGRAQADRDGARLESRRRLSGSSGRTCASTSTFSRSSVATSFAPASLYSASANPAASPAPFSISTVEAEPDELLHRLGCRRDSALARDAFASHCDHAVVSSCRSVRPRAGYRGRMGRRQRQSRPDRRGEFCIVIAPIRAESAFASSRPPPAPEVATSDDREHARTVGSRASSRRRPRWCRARPASRAA